METETSVKMTPGNLAAITGDLKSISITVDGTVAERCPLVGCWFTLRDPDGKLFVDLAPTGLSASKYRPGSRLQVTGHIGQTREGKIGFIAERIKSLK